MAYFEENDEAVEEVQDATENPEQEVQEEAAPQDDVVTVSRHEWNQQAAARRIAERDRRVQEERLNMLLSTLQQAAAQNNAVKDEEPEEEVDPNDAAAVLKKQNEMILKELQAQKAMTEQQKQVAAVQQAISSANQQVRDYAAQNPPLFMAAMEHLAGVFKDSLELNYPHLTQAELIQMATDAVNREKLQMIARGENVGDALYKRALAYRFDQQGFLERMNNGGGVKENAKQTVAREKKKASSGSIAAMESSPPQKSAINARDARKMTTEQWNKEISSLIASGAIRARTKYGNGRFQPELEDLLEGKGR